MQWWPRAAYGISVVDNDGRSWPSGVATDLGIDKLIKTFEPLKSDDDNAFGVRLMARVWTFTWWATIAYFSYDSFGLVAYKMADLIQPVVEFQPVGQPAGACADVTDVTALSAKQGRTVDCRPESVGRFKLQTVPGYEALDGGALYMTPQYFPANTLLRNASGELYKLAKARVLLYVAYGDAGVIKLDWSDPANPILMAHQDTMGSASATAIANGRVYVADGTGGLVVFK